MKGDNAGGRVLDRLGWGSGAEGILEGAQIDTTLTEVAMDSWAEVNYQASAVLTLHLQELI